MHDKFAGERIAQGHCTAEQDQDGVKADTNVLNNVAEDSTTNPDQIESADAGQESGEQVHPSIPAMKARCVCPNLRNKLKRSADGDNHGHDKVQGEGEIAHAIAG